MGILSWEPTRGAMARRIQTKTEEKAMGAVSGLCRF